MNTTPVKQFNIIGIAVRTTNENGQAAADIPLLWNRFMSENIISKIPGKTDEDIYCLYTDYESDFTKPYTTILGCKVASLDTIPEGFTGKKIEDGNYAPFVATGNINEGVVYLKWQEIWNSDLQRAYTTDFEVYGSKAKDPANATIDIFIAVK